jgi:hypothetical protein
MSESLLVASRYLREALASFEPEVRAGEDCATLAEELARTGRAGLLGENRKGVNGGKAGGNGKAQPRNGDKREPP